MEPYRLPANCYARWSMDQVLEWLLATVNGRLAADGQIVKRNCTVATSNKAIERNRYRN